MKQSELKLMSIMSAAFSRLKMSPVQIAILSCIGLNPGIRFGEIANRVSVSSSRSASVPSPEAPLPEPLDVPAPRPLQEAP